MKKNTNTKLILIAFLFLVTAWLIWFTVPKLYELYNTDSIIEKTDTITKVDTLYLDKVFIDSVPKVKYITITKRDTLYSKEGDSLVAYPMLVKKKCIRKQRLSEMTL